MSCDVGEMMGRLENEQSSSVASPTSQLFLEPFFRVSYVTGSSLTSPGEPSMDFTTIVRQGSDEVQGKPLHFEIIMEITMNKQEIRYCVVFSCFINYKGD